MLEHVPNPVGWLNQILEVTSVGGIISLALPRKEYCFDKFRSNTTVAELLDAYFEDYKVPSTRQIYDFLSRGIAQGYVGSEFISDKFEDCPKSYTIQDSLNFAKYVYETGKYLDVHCSVFQPETFSEVFHELCELGIMNVAIEIVDTGREETEFFVRLRKLGDPTYVAPKSSAR